MEKGKHLYYRGSLRSCNYSCGYCPFSKRTMGAESLQRDRERLERLARWLKDEGRDVESLLLVPYGEALIHPYYWEVMGRVSGLPFIEAVGCQTNASFPVEGMLRLYERAGGQIRKLRLWCTFHPSMTTLSAFLEQCRLLLEWKTAFCVGTVGDPDGLGVIRALRERLPASVYVWVNRMEGMKRAYTKEEREQLLSVDPFFYLEERHWKADATRCTGGTGRSLFADASGTLRPCNISRKWAGNWYGTEELKNTGKLPGCGTRECSCYLAYCNRLDLEERVFFEPYPAFRIPRMPKAAFFDVDGTLTDEKTGEIRGETVDRIRRFSKSCDIYLATSLPYPNAMRRCAAIGPYLCGGVFANGGMLVYGKEKRQVHTIPMEKELMEEIKRLAGNHAAGFRCYREKGAAYKITLMFGKNERKLEEFRKKIRSLEGRCHMMEEDGRVQITAPEADKKNGVLRICRERGYAKEEVLAAGNSRQDLPWLEAFPDFSIHVKQHGAAL